MERILSQLLQGDIRVLMPPRTAESRRQVRRAGASQYITCHCAGLDFGVAILSVEEIRRWDGVVSLMPQAPPPVLGVMNVRGLRMPALDLRHRLGLKPRTPDRSSVVVVVRVDGAAYAKPVGLVVDGVSTVRSFGPADVTPPAEAALAIDHECLSGNAAVDGREVLLLDLRKLVDGALQRTPKLFFEPARR